MSQKIAPTDLLTSFGALPEKSLIDEARLAAAFNVSVRTIIRWVKQGDLPAPASFGGKKIWMAGKILAFIEERIANAENAGNRNNKAVNRAQTP